MLNEAETPMVRKAEEKVEKMARMKRKRKTMLLTKILQGQQSLPAALGSKNA